MRSCSIVAALVAVIVGQPPCCADQADLIASKDNTLYESDTGSLSNGVGEYFFAGRTSLSVGSIRRGVLAFEVAAEIPVGATIESAQLSLHLSRTGFNAGPVAVNLHRLLQDWGEGMSDSTVMGGGQGAAAQQDDATWLHALFPGTLWRDADGLSITGGFFESTPVATQTVDGIGFYTWSGPELTATIQDMLDNSATNFGFAVLGDESRPGTAKRFDSKDHANSTLWPRLIVDFTPPLPRCDLDGNGNCDRDDIDLLVSEGDLTVGVVPSQPKFDLTGDGIVNEADIDAWLALAGAENLTSGNSYLRGDANLDGIVDASDFNIWNAHKFTMDRVWSEGDFNGDGLTDASDFNIWNARKFQSALDARVVPEPATCSTILVAMGCLVQAAMGRKARPA